jgi:hypothetical protein
VGVKAVTKRSVLPKPAREQTAYHQAGYCIAAVVQDALFDYVTIREGIDFLRSLLHPNVFGYEPTSATECRTTARVCIIVAYAGLEAQKLFEPAANESPSADDDSEALWLSRKYGITSSHWRYIGDNAHVAHLHRLRSEARRLIQRNQSAVKEIAKSLLQRETLNYERAKEMALRAGAR